MNLILIILACFIVITPVIICLFYFIRGHPNESDAPSANRPTLSSAPSAVSDAPSAGSAAVEATDPEEGGLDPCVIGSLPLVKCGRAAEECPICLTQFGQNETVKLIPRCGHVFHPPCIDMWLLSKKTCPMCRSDQLFGGGFCSHLDN